MLERIGNVIYYFGCIIAVVVIYTSAANVVLASDATTSSAMPLDKQEEVENIHRAIDSLANLKNLTNQVTTQKYDHCMKAIGNKRFCDCFANNAPVAVNFNQYVEFFSYRPEEFDYEALSPKAKDLYSKIRNVRDLCVKLN